MISNVLKQVSFGDPNKILFKTVVKDYLRNHLKLPKEQGPDGEGDEVDADDGAGNASDDSDDGQDDGLPDAEIGNGVVKLLPRLVPGMDQLLEKL